MLYRLIIGRKFLLYTLSSKNLNGNTPWKYCCVEKSANFFDKMSKVRTIFKTKYHDRIFSLVLMQNLKFQMQTHLHLQCMIWKCTKLCITLDLTRWPLFLCQLSSNKAELLQLKPYTFICMNNSINKKVGNRKN